MKKILALSILFFASIFSVIAQDITKGTWYNQEKTSRVQFYEVNGKMYGKVVWLKEPNENGKPRVDKLNPDAKLQSTPLIGLVFLKNFKKVSEKKWEDGTIYDPKNGKTYSCIITQTGLNTLDARGYIGISLIGRTTKFTRAEN
jgi:uncharacterized protein (DUF2147 family)